MVDRRWKFPESFDVGDAAMATGRAQAYRQILAILDHAPRYGVDNGKACEGCGEVATTRDDDETPLCDACYGELPIAGEAPELEELHRTPSIFVSPPCKTGGPLREQAIRHLEELHRIPSIFDVQHDDQNNPPEDEGHAL